jgi:hypothetical protein
MSTQPTHRRRAYVSVDKKLDNVQKKSESRAYQTLHERQLLELFTPHFNSELSRKLLNGTASALSAAISFHQCVLLVGQTIDSETLESSKRFANSIRDHRRRLECFSRWTVVSEPHATSIAKTLDLGEDHTAVLSSEVVGSEALFYRDVNAVCGFSDKVIAIDDARVCACGAVIAQKDRLKQAVSKFGHCCGAREKLARSVVSRTILSLPHFPFTVLCGPSGNVIGPVFFGSAIALLHHEDVLPVVTASEEDITFWRHNASLCLRLTEMGSAELRASSHPTHLCPPSPREMSPYTPNIAALAVTKRGYFKDQCTIVDIE